MKRILSIVLLLLLLFGMKANAEEYQGAVRIRATCYTGYNKTYLGRQPYDGCRYLSGKKEWLGCVAALYRDDNGKKGRFLGYYEFVDTGSAESLNNGTSIDIWKPDLDECWDWVEVVGDYVFIEIYEGVG